MREFVIAVKRLNSVPLCHQGAPCTRVWSNVLTSRQRALLISLYDHIHLRQINGTLIQVYLTINSRFHLIKLVFL